MSPEIFHYIIHLFTSISLSLIYSFFFFFDSLKNGKESNPIDLLQNKSGKISQCTARLSVFG